MPCNTPCTALQSSHRCPAAVAAVCCTAARFCSRMAYISMRGLGPITQCAAPLMTLGMQSCRQMEVRERGGGVYQVFTHEGVWRQRKPRPLYWKARVVQGFGRGSRNLVSWPTLWQHQQEPPPPCGHSCLAWSARCHMRSCHMCADSAPACGCKACWQSTAGTSAIQERRLCSCMLQTC